MSDKSDDINKNKADSDDEWNKEYRKAYDEMMNSMSEDITEEEMQKILSDFIDKHLGELEDKIDLEKRETEYYLHIEGDELKTAMEDDLKLIHDGFMFGKEHILFVLNYFKIEKETKFLGKILNKHYPDYLNEIFENALKEEKYHICELIKNIKDEK